MFYDDLSTTVLNRTALFAYFVSKKILHFGDPLVTLEEDEFKHRADMGLFIDSDTQIRVQQCCTSGYINRFIRNWRKRMSENHFGFESGCSVGLAHQDDADRDSPVNTGHSPNAVSMLDQSRRRRANIEIALGMKADI